MADKPTSSQTRVFMIGPVGAGKSTLVLDMMEAIFAGNHGYREADAPRLESVHLDIPKTIEELRAKPAFEDRHADHRRDSVSRGYENSTELDRIERYNISLDYIDGASLERRQLIFEVMDSAGEHFFPNAEKKTSKSENNSVFEIKIGEADSQQGEPTGPLAYPGPQKFPKTTEEVLDGIAGAIGLVVVVPCTKVATAAFVNQFARVLDVLAQRSQLAPDAVHMDSDSRKVVTERIVIAVSMIDLLFMPFGPYANFLAASPQFSKLTLSDIFRRSGVRSLYESKILRHARSHGGLFDIAVVPTSSHGFHATGGYADTDPLNTKLVNENNQIAARPFASNANDDAPLETENDSPGFPEGVEAIYPRHPFLVADPFIFAATALRGAFHFDLGELMHRSVRPKPVATVVLSTEQSPQRPPPERKTPDGVMEKAKSFARRLHDKFTEQRDDF